MIFHKAIKSRTHFELEENSACGYDIGARDEL